MAPMPLDPEFVADCFYGPGGQLLEEILEIEPRALTHIFEEAGQHASPFLVERALRVGQSGRDRLERTLRSA